MRENNILQISRINTIIYYFQELPLMTRADTQTFLSNCKNTCSVLLTDDESVITRIYNFMLCWMKWMLYLLNSNIIFIEVFFCILALYEHTSFSIYAIYVVALPLVLKRAFWSAICFVPNIAHAIGFPRMPIGQILLTSVLNKKKL